MCRPSGTWAIPSRTIRSGRSRVIAFPSSATSPDAARTTPETADSSVVFPAPFAPMSATISFSFTWSDTDRSAWIMP